MPALALLAGSQKKPGKVFFNPKTGEVISLDPRYAYTPPARHIHPSRSDTKRPPRRKKPVVAFDPMASAVSGQMERAHHAPEERGSILRRRQPELESQTPVLNEGSIEIVYLQDRSVITLEVPLPMRKQPDHVRDAHLRGDIDRPALEMTLASFIRTVNRQHAIVHGRSSGGR